LTATGVDISGTISASSGSFTGTISTSDITATGGTVGGWTLTSSSITHYGGASGQYAGILDTVSTGLAFFAGAATSSGTSAAFSVNNQGAVIASNITIQGANSTITGAASAGLITMKALTGQVGAVIEAQKSDGTTTGSVLGLRAGGGGTTGTLGGTIGAVVVYDGTGDQGTLVTGGLMISNDYTKAGSASYPLPKDGVIVFTDSVTSSYVGGGDLFQNPINTLRTSGNFRIGGNLTVDGSYGLAAGDLPTHSHSLGTQTTGNYIATITSANSLITVTGSGVEAGAVTLTGDLTPSFTSVATGTLSVSGAATFTDDVNLGNATTDEIKATNLYATSTITNSRDVRIFFGATSGSNIQWRLFQDSSSLRYKTNVVNIPDSDNILDVVPITYHDKVQFEEMGEESPRQYGFLAEDMAENIDGQSYVVYNEDGTPEAIQYSRLAIPLHSAMRKLRSRIDELESRLAALENA
jgi:hypothetical protein